MNNRYIIKLRPLISTILLFLFMCSDILSNYISSYADYMDEAVALVMTFVYIIYILRHSKIKKEDFNVILIVIVLMILGFLGNAFSDIQNNIIYQLFDAFNIFKFILAILGARIFYHNYKNKNYIIAYLSEMLKLLVIISSIFMVLNLFADVFNINLQMYTDYRYGLRAYNFIFTRVGDFYSACIIWLIIFTADLYYRKQKSTVLFIILTLINMCSTLRTRAFAFTILYIALYYIFIIAKDWRFKKRYILPIVAFCYFIAREQFTFYYTGDIARNILLRYGLKTAVSYFPLGSGFATYGTAIAQQHYSSLYETYDFSKYWGLSIEYGSFLTDNYWPAVMAEFGFFGAVIMCILLFRIIRMVSRMADNQYSKLCIYFGFGTLIVSSFASSSFFACTQMVFFMCFVSQLVPQKSINQKPAALYNEQSYKSEEGIVKDE